MRLMATLEHRLDSVEPAAAVITLAYYDVEGRLVDSEEFHVSPDAGSVWIKPSERIMSWPGVRTVRASLVRRPTSPVDIEVHLLPQTCAHSAPDVKVGHPERF
jgi:hypothetical protein